MSQRQRQGLDGIVTDCNDCDMHNIVRTTVKFLKGITISYDAWEKLTSVVCALDIKFELVSFFITLIEIYT